jgi:hypothetical protein
LKIKLKNMLKRVLFFFPCFFGILCTLPTVKAQTVNGTAGVVSQSEVNNENAFYDNAMYFKAGVASPAGAFGQSPKAYRSISDSFNGKDGTGAKPGVDLEVGLITYLNELFPDKKYKVGIDIGLAATFHKIDWQGLGGSYQKADYSPFIFTGLKVGPVISYKVANRFMIDGFVKLNPVTAEAGKVTYRVTTDAGTDFLTVEANQALALKKSAGLNLRFGAFLVGFEYNFGKVKYKLTETAYTTYRNTSPDSPYSETLEVKTPTDAFLFTTGFKF